VAGGGRVNTEITEVGEGMENGQSIRLFSMSSPPSVSSVWTRFPRGWLAWLGARVNTEITEVGEGMENGHGFCSSLCPRSAR